MKMNRVSTEELQRGENLVSPVHLVQVLWRRLWAIVLVAVVVTGSAIGFSLLQPPVYEASVTILVNQTPTDAGTSLSGDVEGLQQLTQTIADAVETRPIAQAVVEQLGLPEGYTQTLLQNLSAEAEPGTMFVNVSYEASDPERARLIADTVGSVFSERISELSPGANAITATVWEPAVLPEAPVRPDPLRNAAVALVLGTFLGVGLAFLLEYLDDSWSSPEEVEWVSGVPTFGVIPKFEDLADKRKSER